MNRHRLLIAVVGNFLLCGCFGGGGGGFGLTPAEVRSRVVSNLNHIAISLSAEQVFEASKFVHPSFELQPEVARKFDVGPFEGKGQHAFRSFFDRVVEKYGNLSLAFTIQRIDVEHNLATAYVQVHFSANNTDAVPPANLDFSENDIMVFEWDGETMALINWGENPHNQGGGGGF